MSNKKNGTCMRTYGGIKLTTFIHLLFCTECRRSSSELTSLLVAMSKTAPHESRLSDDSIFQKAVHVYAKANPKSLSEWIWNLSGILIISCSVVFSFSSHYESMKVILGTLFQIIVSLMWGILVSVFVCYYVFSHYRKLSRLNEYLKSLRNIHV